jgi:hypothetical protein
MRKGDSLRKKIPMTKAEVRAWAARWRRVNDIQRQELHHALPLVKLRQLASLMTMARELGWTSALAEGEAEVRQRWNKLRKAHGV